ncbi:diacylglycerol O-acyltransferase 2-like [Xenia sp. Carnegie-2017]|uniref:diacylglycerol O-acyltransferase 2-like n=1 Tax=Xenia sp. Carnegie-2017 TaxID=2897299 RepID=UPI001F03DC63|nr:diacylglycerol O-acyltransferase 2-like [Xenia sp. Carnegie-2017]
MMSKIGISLKTTGKSSVIVKVFQVIVVTAVCGTFTFGHVISLIVMICNMTNIIILPFILVYLFWFLVYDFKRSSKGGRRWETLRKLSSWNYYRDYFPVRLVKTTQLSPEKNYIFGYHPHGVMCSGAWCNFATEATGFGKLFPGLTPHLLTLKLLHWFPFYRDLLSAFGICDVSKESIVHILSKSGGGNVAIIVVGGAAESLDAHPGLYRLTLKNRKGFVKMAIRTGASLVPVMSFGENDLFNQPKNPPGSRLRQWQNSIQKIISFAPVMFFGRLFVLPHQKPINTIVGAPIHVKKKKNPSLHQVNRIHKKYISSLKNIFNHHKTKYGENESTPLIID